MCDLLDLLGGSDEALKPSSAPNPSINTASSPGGDLLDLLGGLDLVPLTPGETLKYTHIKQIM